MAISVGLPVAVNKLIILFPLAK